MITQDVNQRHKCLCKKRDKPQLSNEQTNITQGIETLKAYMLFKISDFLRRNNYETHFTASRRLASALSIRSERTGYNETAIVKC